MNIDIIKPIEIYINDTNIIDTTDVVFDVLGLTGGLTLSLCLIPQIIKVLKTKSVNDLSLSWLFISFLGLIQMQIYVIYYVLIPLLISLTIEIILIIILISLKFLYNKKNIKNKEIEIIKKNKL